MNIGQDITMTSTNVLIDACKSADVSFVRTLIDKGADCTAVDENGWTPLHFSWHCAQIASMLIRRDADVNAKNSAGNTTLMLACHTGHFDVVKVLVEHGADVNIRSNRLVTALMFASLGGYYDIVRYLIASGARVNDADDEGWTSLLWACRKGYTQIVSLLLEHGADVGAQTVYDESILDWALYSRNAETIRVVLNSSLAIDTAKVLRKLHESGDLRRAKIFEVAVSGKTPT
jgi:ankyrin repeat-rich membrane spanning protein